ncbi:LuxR C-terminal-related transcriptional regulator [Saccharothrix espanaensis]|nr:LuxR C-terminal-related transcriptional regulator [Saccharothrix espanaensis]
MAGRLGNKAIATRLHISPRTVEKHVASLITKTAQPDRESLSAFAADLGPSDRP